MPLSDKLSALLEKFEAQQAAPQDPESMKLYGAKKDLDNRHNEIDQMVLDKEQTQIVSEIAEDSEKLQKKKYDDQVDALVVQFPQYRGDIRTMQNQNEDLGIIQANLRTKLQATLTEEELQQREMFDPFKIEAPPTQEELTLTEDQLSQIKIEEATDEEADRMLEQGASQAEVESWKSHRAFVEAGFGDPARGAEVLENVALSIGSALWGAAGSFTGLPNLTFGMLYEALAWPQNQIAKYVPGAERAEVHFRDLARSKYLPFKHLNESADKLMAASRDLAQSRKTPEGFYDTDILSDIANLDMAQAGEKIFYGLMEQVPQYTTLLAAYATGNVVTGLGIIASMAAGGKYNELKDKEGIGELNKFITSANVGLTEYLFESIGTGKTIETLFKNRAVKKAFNQGIIKGIRTLSSPFAREFSEEGATQIAENIGDIIIGKRDDKGNLPGIFDNFWDSAIIGGFAGLGMSVSSMAGDLRRGEDPGRVRDEYLESVSDITQMLGEEFGPISEEDILRSDQVNVLTQVKAEKEAVTVAEEEAKVEDLAAQQERFRGLIEEKALEPGEIQVGIEEGEPVAKFLDVEEQIMLEEAEKELIQSAEDIRGIGRERTAQRQQQIVQQKIFERITRKEGLPEPTSKAFREAIDVIKEVAEKESKIKFTQQSRSSSRRTMGDDYNAILKGLEQRGGDASSTLVRNTALFGSAVASMNQTTNIPGKTAQNQLLLEIEEGSKVEPRINFYHVGGDEASFIIPTKDGKTLKVAVDINSFKPFNDTYGEPFGDIMLKDIFKPLEMMAGRAEAPVSIPEAYKALQKIKKNHEAIDIKLPDGQIVNPSVSFSMSENLDKAWRSLKESKQKLGPNSIFVDKSLKKTYNISDTKGPNRDPQFLEVLGLETLERRERREDVKAKPRKARPDEEAAGKAAEEGVPRDAERRRAKRAARKAVEPDAEKISEPVKPVEKKKRPIEKRAPEPIPPKKISQKAKADMVEGSSDAIRKQIDKDKELISLVEKRLSDTKETEKLEQRGEAAPQISAEEYRKIAKQNLKKQRKEVRKANREKAGILGYVLAPISTQLAKIDPRLEASLRKFEFVHMRNKIVDGTAIQPFLKGVSKMTRSDRAIMNAATLAADSSKIKELVNKYGLKQEYAAMRRTLDDILERLREVGYDVKFLKEFFPRSVINHNGLISFLMGTEEWGAIDKAIREKEKEVGILDDEDRAKVVNNVLRGFGNKVTLSKPGALKPRTVDIASAEILPFYDDFASSMMRYIDNMNVAIAAREFFGKRVGVDPEFQNFNEDIGAFVDGLIVKHKLSPQQQGQLISILRSRFNFKISPKPIRTFKNIGFLTTILTGVSSSITQLGELGYAWNEAGMYRTIKAVGKALVRKSEFTKADVGIDTIGEEYRELDGFSKFVGASFKAVGFTAMDALGKEVLINSSLEKFRKRALKNDPKLKPELLPVFEEETNQLISDLKNNLTTDNVRLLVFNKVLEYQPVALSEMPQAYLDASKGRIFYSLKTFQLKRLDVMRRKGIDQIRNGKGASGKAKGLVILIRMAAILTICEASMDAIKDLFYGRDLDLTDTVIDNIMKLFGFSRYIVWQGRRSGWDNAILQLTTPPLNVISAPTKDITEIVRLIKVGKFDEFMVKNMQTWNIVPFFGKQYFWWFGKGRDITKKQKEREAKEASPKKQADDLLKESSERKFTSAEAKEFDRLVEQAAEKNQISFRKANRMRIKFSANQEITKTKPKKQVGVARKEIRKGLRRAKKEKFTERESDAFMEMVEKHFEDGLITFEFRQSKINKFNRDQGKLNP